MLVGVVGTPRAAASWVAGGTAAGEGEDGPGTKEDEEEAASSSSSWPSGEMAGV